MILTGFAPPVGGDEGVVGAETAGASLPGDVVVGAVGVPTAAGASVGLVAWLYEHGGFVIMLQTFGALCLLVILAAIILPTEIKVPAASASNP